MSLLELPAEGAGADLPSASNSASGEEDDEVFFVSLNYRGNAYEVPVQAGDSVSSIFDFVQEVLDFPRENCKLICKGKVLRPDDTVRTVGKERLVPGAKLMLMATSAQDIAYVQNSRADPLVKGFAEEERDERNRKKRAKAAQINAWGTKQDMEYRFNKVKAEFKYSSPSPYEAEKLLEKLTTDPGIIEIMKTRRFTVGILTEMSPQEAQDRMAKKGTPNMDLLGYNQNAGEMIVLRLRTDNTKGFRPYHDLINTLIHELTHNVWGPHDDKFWKLFGELKAQYMKFHRFWSHGGRAADSNATGQFNGFADDDGQDAEGGAGFGRVLGSAAPGGEADVLTDAQRRERAIAAAEARKVTPTSGFDFVNSGGKMVIVCPCGQIHDPKDCPLRAALKAMGADDDDLEKEPTESQVVDLSSMMDVDSSAAAAMQAAAEQAAAPAAAAAPPLEPVLQEAAEAPLASNAAASDAAAMDIDEVTTSPTAAPATEQSTQAADVGPLLSKEDLEALGLDGAAVWLQHFSERLKALSSSQPAAARGAIELLLRLVSNIVDSPHDAKFRRVRADNPKIRARLLGAGPEVEQLMTLLGFEAVSEDGERIFLLRDATFDSVRLRMGQELLEQQLVAAH